jgi:hypothetical protein
MLKLFKELVVLEDDFCKDRIIHLGIFEILLKLIKEKFYGKWICQESLGCVLRILTASNIVNLIE